ncbi:MAG TPA: hypothetical protein DEF51_52515 [Myxococcales bacterium]|nr:hypothetical protein [Myxococcales bacterium]
MSPTPTLPTELVVVVDDDPAVGAHIADELEGRGVECVHVQDFDVAYEIAVHHRPALMVIDQILESEEGSRLLRKLDALEDAPWVVLLRYAPGPTGPFRNLHVTLISGESWFEDLPDVVARQVYARAY